MAPPALPNCLGLPYWHHQLVLSCYPHQPESHQLSLHNSLVLSELERSGPIDRTPGIPGSDKKSILLDSLGTHLRILAMFNLDWSVYLFLEQYYLSWVDSRRRNWKCYLPSILIILYGVRRGEDKDWGGLGRINGNCRIPLPSPPSLVGISTFRRGEGPLLADIAPFWKHRRE